MWTYNYNIYIYLIISWNSLPLQVCLKNGTFHHPWPAFYKEYWWLASGWDGDTPNRETHMVSTMVVLYYRVAPPSFKLAYNPHSCRHNPHKLRWNWSYLHQLSCICCSPKGPWAWPVSIHSRLHWPSMAAGHRLSGRGMAGGGSIWLSGTGTYWIVSLPSDKLT